jgi:hypothetical protein
VKLVRAIASIVLLATLGAGISCYVRDRVMNRRFDRVGAGMLEQQIIPLMGKPDRVGACGELGGGLRPMHHNVPFVYILLMTTAYRIDMK